VPIAGLMREACLARREGWSEVLPENDVGMLEFAVGVAADWRVTGADSALVVDWQPRLEPTGIRRKQRANHLTSRQRRSNSGRWETAEEEAEGAPYHRLMF